MTEATCWWHEFTPEPSAKPVPLDLVVPPFSTESIWGDEAEDVATTLNALRPHLKAGVSHWKLGSVCGAAAEDVLRFVAGKASLTHAARLRLREWAGAV